MTRNAEARGAALATVAAVAVISTFVAGKATRDAIVLEHFDVSVLPWLVGTVAVLSLPVVLITARLLARFGPGRVVPAIQAGSAIALTVEWFVLRVAPRPGAIAIYIHLGTLGSVLVSGFWSHITERFDAGVARRHIGRIGFGATLGGVVGGVVVERTGAWAATDTTVLVLAAMQLACGALLSGLDRGHTVATHEATAPSLATVVHGRLLRTLAAVVGLGSIAAVALDFELKAELAASGHSVLRALALFYAVTSVATAVVQLAISRDVIARLGVPRSVAVLPLGVIAASLVALAVPSLVTTALARGIELITRSSIYRSAYELMYAPLAEQDKRPTKVVIDVGADRIGDLAGAQLVALVIHLFDAPRPVLLVLAASAAAVALSCALRLRRRYAEALEHNLLLGHRGHGVVRTLVSVVHNARGGEPPPRRGAARDPLAERLLDLRSGDVDRTTRALAPPLAPELAHTVIPLLAWDAVADAARTALCTIAPRNTGVLADALLDLRRPFAVRRRIASVLVAGQAELATWALWRGLDDPRFEVRYRCGRALGQLRAAGSLPGITADAVFAAVIGELSRRGGGTPRLLDRDGATTVDQVVALRAPSVLRHVFALLGLALPPRTVDIALEAISTDEPALRATALEYLESVLPSGVQAALWKAIDGGASGAARPHDQAVAALEAAHPSIRASLDRLARTTASARDA